MYKVVTPLFFFLVLSFSVVATIEFASHGSDWVGGEPSPPPPPPPSTSTSSSGGGGGGGGGAAVGAPTGTVSSVARLINQISGASPYVVELDKSKISVTSLSIDVENDVSLVDLSIGSYGTTRPSSVSSDPSGTVYQFL